MTELIQSGAWNLLGRELVDGWKAVKPLGRDLVTGEQFDYDGTGGNFSVTYLVERKLGEETETAFLKAIDLAPVMESDDPAQTLTKIMNEYRFETDVLELCSGQRMTRVATALQTGQIKVGPNLQDLAPYIIFELAEGDVRRRLKTVDESVRMSWWLRAMHHTAVGLSQMHSNKISHQDLKPSNVLVFDGSRGFRISDLGRSVCGEKLGPYDEMKFAGDKSYAPPEVLYGYVSEEWTDRHLGADAYLLGSMIFFYCRGAGATQLLFDKVGRPHRPPAFGGPWTVSYRQVLPMLQYAFTQILEELDASIDSSISSDLVRTANELCTPDPNLRGHSLERMNRGHNYSLQRYISMFDRLAKRAEIESRVRAQ